MIRSPRHLQSYGQRTTAFAESLDFYRTLNALAVNAGGAAVSVEQGVEGADLTPLFTGPFVNGVSTAAVHNASYSQMARCPTTGFSPESACNSVKLVDTKYMGYTVRVDEYRYTAWMAFNGTKNRALWSDPSGLAGEELYSHVGDKNDDYDAFENENLAMKPEHKSTRDELWAMVRARFDTPGRVP
jgi:hypothetical protein